jgi:hypothetical protein
MQQGYAQEGYKYFRFIAIKGAAGSSPGISEIRFHTNAYDFFPVQGTNFTASTNYTVGTNNAAAVFDNCFSPCNGNNNNAWTGAEQAGGIPRYVQLELQTPISPLFVRIYSNTLAGLYSDFDIAASNTSLNDDWTVIAAVRSKTSADYTTYNSNTRFIQVPLMQNVTPPAVAGAWQYTPGTNEDIFYSGRNVGIGTTTPTEKLEVTGNLKVSGTAKLNALEVNGIPFNPANTQVFEVNNNLATATKQLQIQNASIGTLEINNQINLKGSTSIIADTDDDQRGSTIVIQAGNGAVGLPESTDGGMVRIVGGQAAGIGGTGGHIILKAGKNPYNYDNSGHIFLADANGGNIAIGYDGTTLLPQEKMDLSGNLKVRGITKTDFLEVAGVALNPQNLSLFSLVNGNIQTNKNMNMTSGKLGIGITEAQMSSANYRLFVKDGIRTEAIRVDLVSSWADYVFEKNYQLRKLSEVERYIVKNKHLPDVPSEAELKKEGIDLAEMDAILLRKIEELTLYIIEQDKKIAELEHKIKLK